VLPKKRGGFCITLAYISVKKMLEGYENLKGLAIIQDLQNKQMMNTFRL
jgi:hypothetical protein